jgi:hypothetical protein
MDNTSSSTRGNAYNVYAQRRQHYAELRQRKAIQVMHKSYARKGMRWATPQVTRRAIRQVSAPAYAKGNVLGNVQARDTGNECM